MLGHDQAEVWKMLTDPSLLPQWLAPGNIALSKGGSAKLSFPESGTNVDSVVTDVAPLSDDRVFVEQPGGSSAPPAMGGASRKRRRTTFVDAQDPV
jgi:hypothetical protein